MIRFNRFINQLLANVPLRTILVVPFLIQIFAAVGLTGYLSFHNSYKAVNNLATQLQQEVAERIQLKLDTYLAMPRLVNQLNADAIYLQELNINNLKHLENHFSQQMYRFETLHAIAFSDPTGSSIAIKREENGMLKVLVTHNDPNTPEAIASADQFVKRTGGLLDLETTTSWSKIFPQINEGELKINANQAIYDQKGKLQGFVSSTLMLSQLSQFLQNLKISPSGEAFIVEPSGLLVASSTQDPPFAVEEQTITRINALDSHNSLIQNTSQYLSTQFANFSGITRPQQGNFRVGDQRYFFKVQPLKQRWGLDWLIVVVVPERDFTDEIESNTRVTIALCIIALAIATLSGILTARWITQPLMRLSAASHALAKGELDLSVEVNRRDELGILARAFNQMAHQLRSSFRALEAANSDLEQRVFARTVELAQTTRELKALFEGMTDVVLVLDAQGCCLKVAPTNPTNLYKPDQDAIGKTLCEIFPPEPADQILKCIQQALETQQTCDIEYRLEIQGKPVWFSTLISPLSVDSVIAVARDITERKQVEKELREGEAAIRALYKVASAPKLTFQQRLQGLLALGRRGFGLEIGTIGRLQGMTYSAIAVQIPPRFPFQMQPGEVFQLESFIQSEQLQQQELIDLQATEDIQWCAHPFYPQIQIKSYISARILVAGLPYGLLSFSSISKPLDHFKVSDRQLLKLMAQWVGNEIERQHSRTALEKQIQRTLLLKDMTEQIRSSLDSEQILQTAATQIGQAFGVTYCVIHREMRDPLGNVPFVAEYLQPSYPSLLGLKIPWLCNPDVEEWLQQDRAIASYDVFADPRLKSAEAICRQMGIRSLLTVRTSYQGKQNGGIDLYQCDRLREWTTDEIELLEALAAQLGIAIAQSYLLEQEKQQRQELSIKNTALEKAKSDAEAANRAKGDFLAMMSHELRTPMNAAIGMTELLLASELTTQQRSFAETIRTSGEALLAILNDILDFSKIESGKLELEENPFILRDCIEDAINILAPQAALKKLELAYFISPETPLFIRGDANRLRQILVNLLSNAVKFTPLGEAIVTVSSSRIEEFSSPILTEKVIGDRTESTYRICFAVKDTGIGIAGDRMDRLFKPFSQVDASMTRRYGGTGLGLAISKRLCESMGGTMWVESSVGKGSTFYFTIVVPSVRICPVINLQVLQAHLAQKRLLIIEPHVTNRELISLQAQTWGMQVLSTPSAQEAQNWIKQGMLFDLAVIEMEIPELDSQGWVSSIRSLPGCKNLPLILLTSINQNSLKFATSNDSTEILTKPIKQSQLYAAFTRLFPNKSGSTPTIGGSGISLNHLNHQFAQRLPLRILLVEDIELNQIVALQMLQRLGYAPDLAQNGKEALAKLRDQPYDVVFMDVQMPEMDGIEATRQIDAEKSICLAKNDPYKRPWIIGMTAHAMLSDRAEFLKAGMDDCISKPIRIASITQALIEYERSVTRDHGFHDTHDTTPLFPLNRKISFSALAPLDPQILQELREMAGEDADIILQEVLESYRQDAPQRLQSLQNAIASVDMTAARMSAHALRSLSVSIGAIPLGQLCETLETMNQEDIIQGGNELISQLQLEYERLDAALKREHLG